MNKAEAQKEYEKIILESNQRELEAIEAAKANGTWKQGLDANKELLKEIKKDTYKRLEALKQQIINSNI